MKLMIRISLSHSGQVSGSTSHTFLMHARHNSDEMLQHRQYMSTGELTQRTQIHLRHDKEITALKKQAVSNQCVQMGIPAETVAKRLDGEDNSRNAVFFA